jgi:hypothetical protein
VSAEKPEGTEPTSGLRVRRIDGNEYAIDAPKGDERLGINKWETLAIVYGQDFSGNGPAVARANAFAFAAAPDLLEAAKLTVLHFKRNQASGNFQGDDEHEVWTALEKAISKATGKEGGRS